MSSVVQQRVDVVPHSRGEERLDAIKQPETERERKAKSSISLLAALNAEPVHYSCFHQDTSCPTLTCLVIHVPSTNSLHPSCTSNCPQCLGRSYMKPHTLSPDLDASVAGLSDPAEATTLLQDQLEVQSSTQ